MHSKILKIVGIVMALALSAVSVLSAYDVYYVYGGAGNPQTKEIKEFLTKLEKWRLMASSPSELRLLEKDIRGNCAVVWRMSAAELAGQDFAVRQMIEANYFREHNEVNEVVWYDIGPLLDYNAVMSIRYDKNGSPLGISVDVK
jgi:hypothetical protein